MLRRLALRDFAIVAALDVEFGAGFTVLTGETGAGKSILLDALQLALGARGEALFVREGAARTEVCAEFEQLPEAARVWLDAAGFDAEEPLLLRRTVDSQGKSRAWIAGSPATVTQLRELGEWLVDIHGQHAWQSLARSTAVRELLDRYAGLDTAPLLQAWAAWRNAQAAYDHARGQQASLDQERERLAWQLGELDRLDPAEGEWDEINAEHQRLAHVQSIQAGIAVALQALGEAEPSAIDLTAHALAAAQEASQYDAALADAVAALEGAQAQLADAQHTLQAAAARAEGDPQRLAELDARLSEWVSLARRWRRQPQDLPATRAAWRAELSALESASDIDTLAQAVQHTERAWRDLARAASTKRRQAAPRLARSVSEAMQGLGMAGGRVEFDLQPLETPQAHGLEGIELLVAGHAGTTPRPLGKVASGGELSRIALAVAVTTSRLGTAGTLIFDEVDAGVGGAVADTVGHLMQQLGQDRQVLAVTHLAQVAACADQQWVVHKAASANGPHSTVTPTEGTAREGEIARMLGGQASDASLAHARELLARHHPDRPPARRARRSPGAEHA